MRQGQPKVRDRKWPNLHIRKNFVADREITNVISPSHSETAVGPLALPGATISPKWTAAASALQNPREAHPRRHEC